MRLSLLALVLLLFATTSCTLTWLDHPTSGDLRRELVERSKQGLALGTVLKNEPQIELRFFGGQVRHQPLGCCVYNESALISRNRIVVVDMSSAPRPEAFVNPDVESLRAALTGLGGQVVVMDAGGVVLGRSAIRISSLVGSSVPQCRRVSIYGGVRRSPKNG